MPKLKTANHCIHEEETSKFWTFLLNNGTIDCQNSGQLIFDKSLTLCLSDEMPSAVCLCCHVLVSFLLLLLLLANNELLSETQSDRSCSLRPLVKLMSSVFQTPLVQNQASSNAVHHTTTLNTVRPNQLRQN